MFKFPFGDCLSCSNNSYKGCSCRQEKKDCCCEKREPFGNNCERNDFCCKNEKRDCFEERNHCDKKNEGFCPHSHNECHCCYRFVEHCNKCC